MVRIRGGVFPVMKEPDYLINGEYHIDKGVAPKMLNCLMLRHSHVSWSCEGHGLGTWPCALAVCPEFDDDVINRELHGLRIGAYTKYTYFTCTQA
ncbi:Dolichyl-diphosphooligosaccharide--protein glycosyltransferase subunit STT3 [Gossypium arboreum]|uniref:Dolichyl-diphosphooligosaccharide--protein glycosyltransferase subunit STT3 n=1 Tax=Gossypium arboreum TaxID=29729 RepID=A0A0B0NRK5_GOSAR|nr:Dolichyl-diphosphooligosaccharide--protein glycosyltransferase subunit STT3 [Gossypium arboreum]